MKFEVNREHADKLINAANTLSKYTETEITAEAIVAELIWRFEWRLEGMDVSERLTPGQIGDLIGEIVGGHPPPSHPPGGGGGGSPHGPLTPILNPI
ncbi:hypothetical protein V6961_004487 [Vibrio parahaemolyticus]|uniref:hypothetical protein n=1 Tax=Vibrio parahaemolyticus TaxID=670 RepID=UPI0009983724|nr:hypothetical protein [Vibrio parahaemolyticus]EJC7061802.1 hypothetical protein [Vibrio parahaemolyticus]EJG1918320.1 hypothetical protein [Vibrio parahaemolyticus]OOX69731.1 hypothetical protein BJL74_22645 [Vibrio parahaemolyticus]